MTGPLECDSDYLVRLSAINDGGESERTEENFRTACSQPSSGLQRPPFILFSLGTGLYSKDITIGPAMWDQANLLTEASQHITGLDFHIQKHILYFVTGSLFVADISHNTQTNNIIVSSPRLVENDKIKRRESDLIIDVSVDWLTDKVYFSLESPSDDSQKVVQQFWYFVFCDLNVTKCHNINLSLNLKPKYMKADPYHGYLYWIENNEIFRTHLDSPNFCHQQNQKQLLYSGNKLGPFVVSFSQYSLLVPDMDKNQMVEVSLDVNQAPTTIHNNYNSKVGWSDILSIIQFPNGFDRFYWSSSAGFNIEFLDNKTASYSYSLIETDIKTRTLKLFHPLAQTEPVPVNPVERLQCHLGPSQALVTWRPPVVSASEGCAGYRDWRYQLEVEDSGGQLVITREDITATRLNTGLGSLEPGTLYTVRVRPYSRYGRGPWGVDWSGRTLTVDTIPDLVWTGGGNIHQTNTAGQFHHTVSVNEARNILRNEEDLLWTSGGHIVKMDSLGSISTIIEEGQHISSLALEPLAQRLYYSIPSLRLIKRITLTGREEVSLRVDTSISNLIIHSPAARLCWLSLEISVICSDLEGANRTTLYKVNIWENKRIINIAMNQELSTVYMIVHSSGLYRILEQRLNDNVGPTELKILRSKYVSGGLKYLDRKLFFIENSRHIVSVELDGTGMSGLDSKYTVDSFDISSPNITTVASVVPGKVTADSVKFVKESEGDGLSLSWEAAVIESDLQLRTTYKVGIHCEGSESRDIDTELPVISHLQVASYVQCKISLVARTVYGLSPTTSVLLTTPETRAGPPVNLTVFWSYNNYSVRWTAPPLPNGDILHYVLKCVKHDQDFCVGTTTRDTRMSLDMRNDVYNVSVAAVNNAGVGQFSLAFQTSVSPQRPEPRIVLGQSFPSALLSINIYSNKVRSSFPFSSPIVFVRYLHWKHSYLVLTKDSRLIVLNIESQKYSDLVTLHQEVRALCVDYIGRYLYIANDDSVRRIDLDSESPLIQRVVDLDHRVVEIDYDHSESGLLILSQTKDKYQLARSSISSLGSVSPPVRLESCRCDGLSLSPDTFTLLPGTTQLAVRDLTTGHVYLTDAQMCHCRKIADSNKIREDIILKSDLTNIYIMSKHSREIRTIDLLDFRIQDVPLNSTRSFIFDTECGDCHQVSDMSCLRLGSSDPPRLTKVEADSVDVVLSRPRALPGCSRSLALPSTRYNVSVRAESSDQSLQLQSLNQGNAEDHTVTLSGLTPNTEYHLSVLAYNVYMEGEDDQLVPQTARFRTSESSPSAPQNLTATVLSPYKVSVSWEEPAVQRSDELEYELYWGRDRLERKVEVGLGATSFLLTDLEAGLDYHLWVVARSAADGRSDLASVSPKVKVTMFHLPHNLQVQTQSRRMKVTWTAPDSRNVASHFIQYFAKKTHHDLDEDIQKVNTSVVPVSRPEQEFTYELKHLAPGSCYIIKVFVKYVTGEDWFEYPGEAQAQCHFTSRDVPPVPGVPYISTRGERLAVTWQEAAARDEMVSFELQQRKNVSDNWSTIYSDQNNFHFLTGFQSGRTVSLTPAMIFLTSIR